VPQSLNQPSFAAGELSPELRRRIDIQKYSVGAEIIQNMIVLPRGGVQSRCGTQLVNETKTSSKRSRLVDFVFSITQAYTLEFGDKYIRFYMNGGVILDGLGNIYEVATPYDVADIGLLKFEQSADTLYIVHSSYPPATLTRTAHDNWTLTDFLFINGPLRPENDTAISLKYYLASNHSATVAEKGNTIDIVSSSSIFQSGHVGAIFAIRHVSTASSYYFFAAANIVINSPSFPVWGEWEAVITPGSSKIDGAEMFIERSVDDGVTWYKIHTIAATSDTSQIKITGSESDRALLKITRDSVTDEAAIVISSFGHSEFACAKITSVTNSTNAIGVLQNRFDQCGTSFTTWLEGAWSAYRGYPSSVSFYQNRLGFGNNNSSPNSFWDSKIGDYINFGKEIPTVDDDAISERLLGRTVNSIQWMIPLQAHIMLTGDSEWTVEPSINGAFAPSSLQIKQQTYYGSSKNVCPVIIGESAIFVVRGGSKVRSMGYDDVNGKTGTDLSVMAEHLFDEHSIVDWAYQQIPNSVLWCVRSDGKLLSFTYHKEHDVWAWCRHETDGLFESVCVIPTETQDDVYFIVNRTIGGNTKRFVEIMARRDISDASHFFGVDCGATYEGTATATISGLSHLNGKKVDVLANGVHIKGKTVSSGSITLDVATTKAHVGLPFTWRLKTLQVDASSKSGYASDKKKLIQGTTITVLNSAGGLAGQDQFVNLNYPNITGLYSGDLNVNLLSRWDKDGQFEITGNGALPMHIINIMPRVSVGG
jgi:hypothetical protein